jgi:peptide/nickel transport system ATP-binding protein
VVGGDRCRTELPELYEVAANHHSRCFLTSQQRADVLSKQATAVAAAPEGNEVAR